MSFAKITTYIIGILLVLVGISCISVGVWMIAKGSKGLAFVFSGALVLIVGWYRIHQAKTRFPSVKIGVANPVGSDNNIMAEWTLTEEEMICYIKNINARTNLSAIIMAVFGCVVMFLVGYLMLDFSWMGIFGFSMFIPVVVIIGFVVKQLRHKKWMAGDRKIVIKNLAINLFGNEIALLSSAHWPESASVVEDVFPLMLKINLKYAGRYDRIIPTYIPIPQKKLEEGWQIANHIGTIKSTHVAS
jgi:hypothetical protein